MVEIVKWLENMGFPQNFMLHFAKKRVQWHWEYRRWDLQKHDSCTYMLLYCLKSVAYIRLDYIIISRRQQERNEQNVRITQFSHALTAFFTLTFVGRRNEQRSYDIVNGNTLVLKESEQDWFWAADSNTLQNRKHLET